MPTPQAQIEFLSNLQRLLDEGQFVATYKYALLSAIADLAVETGDDSDSELPISVERIAEKFIEYYWRQVRPYRGEILHQNKGKPAEILRHLVDAQKGCTQLSEFRDNSAAHASLVNQVAKVIRQMPLWRLQTVSGVTLPFLYDASEVNGAIVLKPGVAYCFRAFHGFIRRLLQAEWLSYVRAHRGNLSIIGDTSDLDAFLFGSERGSPANVKPLLMELQHGECIYCRQSLRGAGQVDHFIPWSRYPVDLGHNFVLAHQKCNSAKSDHLAALHHLENWLIRNNRHHTELEAGFTTAHILFDEPTSVRVAQWAYASAERSGGLAWVLGKEFEPLTNNWRALLG